MHRSYITKRLSAVSDDYVWKMIHNKTPCCRGDLMKLYRHGVRTHKANELTRCSSGNAHSKSSQLSEGLWTDPGSKSVINARELISTFFFFLKCRRGKIIACEEKNITTSCQAALNHWRLNHPSQAISASLG